MVTVAGEAEAVEAAEEVIETEDTEVDVTVA